MRRTYDLLRASLPALEPDTLLVEEELVDLLSASRNTVRLVLQLLAAHGLVTRGPKVGTAVTSSTVLPIGELMPIGDQGSGRPMRSTILESAVISPPAIIRKRLAMTDDTPIALIEALIFDDETPIALAVNYVCLPPERSHRRGQECPDVIRMLEDFNVCLGESDTVVAALACDAQTGALLGVDEGSPILWCEDLLRDSGGTPLAISQMRYRADRVTFSATARRRNAQEIGASADRSSGNGEGETPADPSLGLRKPA